MTNTSKSWMEGERKKELRQYIFQRKKGAGGRGRVHRRGDEEDQRGGDVKGKKKSSYFFSALIYLIFLPTSTLVCNFIPM